MYLSLQNCSEATEHLHQPCTYEPLQGGIGSLVHPMDHVIHDSNCHGTTSSIPNDLAAVGIHGTLHVIKAQVST